MTSSDPWRKAPADLVARFHEAVAGIEGVEVRKMFGYPAAFVGGNLTAGLHQENVMVRLPEAEREERLADGWSLFSPMPGRPMREYVAMPPRGRPATSRPCATGSSERPPTYAPSRRRRPGSRRAPRLSPAAAACSSRRSAGADPILRADADREAARVLAHGLVGGSGQHRLGQRSGVEPLERDRPGCHAEPLQPIRPVAPGRRRAARLPTGCRRPPPRGRCRRRHGGRRARPAAGARGGRPRRPAAGPATRQGRRTDPGR